MRTRTLTLFAATTLTLTLAACSGDVQEAKYSSQIEAAKAGAMDQGWIPRWLPEEASNIREVHNLDSNESLMSFTLPAQHQWAPPAACQPAEAAQLPAPAFERNWAPKKLDGYTTYACAEPDSGSGVRHALAIAPDRSNVLYWGSSR